MPVSVHHIVQYAIERYLQSIDQIIDQILELPEGAKLQLLAPVVRGRKGEHKRELAQLRKEGYVRIRVDGEIRELAEDIVLEKNKKHTLEVVIDRIKLKEGVEKRLSDSVETALHLSEGILMVNHMKEDGDEDILFNTNFSCPDHNIGIAEMEPRMFSFNAPYGACETCKGIGHMLKIDPEMVVPDPHLTIAQGAIEPFANSAEGTYYAKLIESVVLDHNGSLDVPFKELPEALKKELLFGTGDREIAMEYESKYGGMRKWKAPFEGVVGNLQRRYHETNSDYMRGKIETYMSLISCESCGGKRLKPEVLAVEVGQRNIWDLTELSVRDAISFFDTLELDQKNSKISEQILKELNDRLSFLRDVGLDYLNLSRSAGTLSGGESQRIRLATQIGSRLMGVLYILDEPSIGLHQKDNEKLLKTLRELTELGNTLIVVEHDEDTIRQADHVLDIGPGAGEHGGEIIAQGTVHDLLANENSITGQYMSGKKSIAIPAERRQPKEHKVTIKGATQNNLQNIDVDIPLGVMTCVTGVSGSGKSSLINEILFKSAANKLNRAKKNQESMMKFLDLNI